jgi:hypothetical protein
MAVEARKSSLITNADEVPAVLNNPRVDGGFERAKIATVAVTNGDSIASTYRLFRVPSNAVMTDLRVYCPAITTAATNIGVYRTEKDGSAVVDADLFTSAQALTSALNGVDVLHESGCLLAREQRQGALGRPRSHERSVGVLRCDDDPDCRCRCDRHGEGDRALHGVMNWGGSG